MKPAGIIGTAAVFLLLGTTAPVRAQEQKPREEPASVDKQDKGKGQSREGKKEDKAQKQDAAPQARREAPPPDRNQQQAGEQKGGRPPQAKHEQPADQNQAKRQQANQQEAIEQQQATQQRQANRQQAVQVRLSQERQQQLITEQRGRVIEYRQYLDQQRVQAERYAARLQQQKRAANYRVQQDYLARMRQQQLALQSAYDYNNDPYFYTAPTYRYSRGGSYYETNEYGARVLRQAINNGYAEGYRAGQADRQDRWQSDYRNSYGYQDANYGYNGYYGNQAEYNYYFREGFNRGYQDGYDSRTQYGLYSNGSRSILGSILAQILNFQSMR